MDLKSPITYKNPPVNEVFYCVIFQPLEAFRIGHLVELSRSFESEFGRFFDDDVRIRNVPEDAFKKSPHMLPIRALFFNPNANDIVQVQCNCFIYNWVKQQPDDVYPGYTSTFNAFEKYFEIFQEFLAKEKIGDITPTRYELTYFDHILENEGWSSLNDLGDVFPNFEFERDGNRLPKSVRDIDWRILFDLPDDFGRLRLGIESQYRSHDSRRVLNLNLSAHSNESYTQMHRWFSIAHDEILRVFVNLVSDKVQEKYWGRQF